MGTANRDITAEHVYVSERLKYVHHKPCFCQSVFSFDSTDDVISECVQYMHHWP